MLPDIDGDPDAELVKETDGVDDVDIIADPDANCVTEDPGAQRAAKRNTQRHSILLSGYSGMHFETESGEDSNST